MNPKFEELHVAFSTADLSSMRVEHSGDSLIVVFTDWRGVESTVVFGEVAAYKWDESSFSHIDASPDRVYRVRDSEWLQRWSHGIAYTHYMLGVLLLTPGSSGYLEVIARSMNLKKPNQAPEPTAPSGRG